MAVKIGYSIYYRINGGEWTELVVRSTTSSTVSINVSAGDKVEFKGTNTTYCDWGLKYNSFATGTATYNVSGNIMSLVYGDDFGSTNELTESYTFSKFFSGNNSIVSAENLILPSASLTSYCYHFMFNGCTSLTTAPSTLPATTLADYCYLSMFFGCTSLTTTPELPVTTLAYCCYSNMFQGCTSLTTAPELPATTLASYCYYGMFQNCTSLTASPELPATTLTSYCYSYMFNGCTSLNTITCLAMDLSADNCLYNWVTGVSSSGTFYRTPATSTSWPTGVSGIPSGWTVYSYVDVVIPGDNDVVVIPGGSN